MWCLGCCGSPSCLHIRISQAALKATDTWILAVTIKSESLRNQANFFFLSPQKVILFCSLGWEPWDRVPRYWQKGPESVSLSIFEIHSKNFRQPELLHCPSARSQARVKLLPLPELETRLNSPTKKPTDLSLCLPRGGQEKIRGESEGKLKGIGRNTRDRSGGRGYAGRKGLILGRETDGEDLEHSTGLGARRTMGSHWPPRS